MFGSNVHLTLPSLPLFHLPPSSNPQALAPPPSGSTLSSPPFTIPQGIYTTLLDVRLPLTIAPLYAVTVFLLNGYNRDNAHGPWPISRTKAFHNFVVVHNVLLALYSAWTWWAMTNAFRGSFLFPSGPEGLARSVDSLCKMHGPGEFGSFMAWNASEGVWSSPSAAVRLGELGSPDNTDVGRLWNEGLAFYGWIFYLSKFYEVLDTLIVLAKGKTSSFLQTYHHFGVMFGVWAGIRYMSPPIWYFVWINSGIHTLMYTYYTLSTLSVSVPRNLKQALTSLQIFQFVTGTLYAALHSFVSYTLPVQVPVIPSSVAAASASTASLAASATATGLSGIFKKYLFRAAGEEGLAENVHASSSQYHLADPDYIGKGGPLFKWEKQMVPCLDTSGQTFAVWINVLYLTPLTWLFARFFVKCYLERSGAKKARGRDDEKNRAAEDSADAERSDARKDSQRTDSKGREEKESADGRKGTAKNEGKQGGSNGKEGKDSMHGQKSDARKAGEQNHKKDNELKNSAEGGKSAARKGSNQVSGEEEETEDMVEREREREREREARDLVREELNGN